MKLNSRPLILAALGALFTATSSVAAQPPVAFGKILSTAEDTAAAITLTAADADGDSLRYAVVALPAHGSLTGTAPYLTYRPAANYYGPDSFTFKANDGSADSNTATVSITVRPVNDAPTGKVRINAGKARVTGNASVVLTLTATDDSVGPIRMCISNTAGCTTWLRFAPRKLWTLTSGSGTKTVNVWFRDRYGKTTPLNTPFSDTILLDTQAPANGNITAEPGDGKLTLRWGGFVDNLPGSGVNRYLAVFQMGTSAPSSCSVGTPVPNYVSPHTTLVHTGLTNGASYAYRVCAVDAVGNMSSGATKVGKPIGDTVPPTGTVTINGGAAFASSTAATLALAAVDAGGGSIQMCISNTAACSAWVPFEATKSWVLAAGDGTATVYVWYRDQWGNTSATPNSDTIFLDTTAPTDGTVTATPGDTQLTLNWSGFADTDGSGIAGYRAVFQVASAPPSCDIGTAVPGYAGTATTLVHGGLINGTTYGYRVCAIDAAGFMSAGATASGHPVSMVCEACHNGDGDGDGTWTGVGYDPDGSGPAPAAPNVMGNGISANGVGTTPKPYDDGTWGYNVNGHGPNGTAPNTPYKRINSTVRLKPNSACSDCHDISDPSSGSGRHLDGTLNSAEQRLNLSTNTVHLKIDAPSFIGTSNSDVQTTLDNACYMRCHSSRSVPNMRHSFVAPPISQFGNRNTRANGESTGWPVDSDISTNAGIAEPDFAPCVTCHNPHGVDPAVVFELGAPFNHMLRGKWLTESAWCITCHL